MFRKGKNLFRRTYGYFAALALLNCVAVAVLAGWGLVSGRLSPQRLAQAWDVLRGHGVARTIDTTEAASPPLPATVLEPQETESLSEKYLADQQAQLDILQHEAKRTKAELEQRLALNNSILLKVQTERRALQDEKQALENARLALEKRDQTQRDTVRDEGFERQVAIFENLSPKIAVQHLLKMNDPDAAARILMALDSDRARRIVEAAKRGPELAAMQVILQRVRETAPPPIIEARVDNG